MRDSGYRGGGIPGPRNWSIVTWLIVINLVVYLVQHGWFMEGASRGDLPPGGLSKEALAGGHVYTLVTHLFIHADLLHLAGNMIIVFVFGRLLLQLVGSRWFMIIYFAGGMFGAMTNLLLEWYNFPPVYLGGASAAGFATLFAVVGLIPRQVFTFLLFFIIPARLSMLQIGLIFLVIDGLILTSQLIGDGSGEIAVYAHLGGALFGWSFVKWLISRGQARSGEDGGAGRESRWKKRFGSRRVVDADVIDGEKSKKRKRPEKAKDAPFVSKDVDAILDKISEQGMQSLTEQERKILEKSSEKLARRVDGQ